MVDTTKRKLDHAAKAGWLHYREGLSQTEIVRAAVQKSATVAAA